MDGASVNGPIRKEQPFLLTDVSAELQIENTSEKSVPNYMITFLTFATTKQFRPLSAVLLSHLGNRNCCFHLVSNIDFTCKNYILSF